MFFVLSFRGELVVIGLRRGCNFAVVDCAKDLLIAGSYTREDIRNYGDKFRARLLFLGSTIFPTHFPLPVMMGRRGDTIHIRTHSPPSVRAG